MNRTELKNKDARKDYLKWWGRSTSFDFLGYIVGATDKYKQISHHKYYHYVNDYVKGCIGNWLFSYCGNN